MNLPQDDTNQSMKITQTNNEKSKKYNNDKINFSATKIKYITQSTNYDYWKTRVT